MEDEAIKEEQSIRNFSDNVGQVERSRSIFHRAGFEVLFKIFRAKYCAGFDMIFNKNFRAKTVLRLFGYLSRYLFRHFVLNHSWSANFRFWTMTFFGIWNRSSRLKIVLKHLTSNCPEAIVITIIAYGRKQISKK